MYLNSLNLSKRKLLDPQTGGYSCAKDLRIVGSIPAYIEFQILVKIKFNVGFKRQEDSLNLA